MPTEAIRELEAEYRRQYQAILASSTSWEQKQREIYRLFKAMQRRKGAVEERSPV